MTTQTATRRRTEQIHHVGLSFRHFPRRFQWRGKDYRVDAVERAWTESRRGGQVRRYRFRVRCADRKFDLYHDLTSNRWFIAGGKQ